MIVLNGTPRSGKTSLAREIQARGNGLWLILGVDAWASVMPPGLTPGIGLRPGGERPDLEPHLPALVAALFGAVAGAARAGANVVVDLGLHADHSRPLNLWTLAISQLESLDVLLVGVRCPVEENLRRRIATGYPADPEVAARWESAVHRDKRYDLEVDTSRTTSGEAADLILRAPGVTIRTFR